MKVSKEIQKKMHKILELSIRMRKLSNEVDQYFIDKGFDIDELRSGDGLGLEELEYSNDIIDEFCKYITNGYYKRHM